MKGKTDKCLQWTILNPSLARNINAAKMLPGAADFCIKVITPR